MRGVKKGTCQWVRTCRQRILTLEGKRLEGIGGKMAQLGLLKYKHFFEWEHKPCGPDTAGSMLSRGKLVSLKSHRCKVGTAWWYYGLTLKLIHWSTIWIMCYVQIYRLSTSKPFRGQSWGQHYGQGSFPSICAKFLYRASDHSGARPQYYLCSTDYVISHLVYLYIFKYSMCT